MKMIIENKDDRYRWVLREGTHRIATSTHWWTDAAIAAADYADFCAAMAGATVVVVDDEGEPAVVKAVDEESGPQSPLGTGGQPPESREQASDPARPSGSLATGPAQEAGGSLAPRYFATGNGRIHDREWGFGKQNYILKLWAVHEDGMLANDSAPEVEAERRRLLDLLNRGDIARRSLAREITANFDALAEGLTTEVTAARLRQALARLTEHAAELRSYCNAWEWKYKESWDEEEAAIKALYVRVV